MLALCRRFDEVLGPHGRRLIYVRMLAQRRRCARLQQPGRARLGGPCDSHRLAARDGRSCATPLGIRPGVEVEDEAQVWRELDGVAELLADGRPYLHGERFGAADLTFAALAAPVILPADYGVTLPQPEELDEVTARIVERARAHPAGQYALKLIAQERRAPVLG